MLQSQDAANPWHKEEEKMDTSQHAQNRQTHEKHTDELSLPQAKLYRNAKNNVKNKRTKLKARL